MLKKKNFNKQREADQISIVIESLGYNVIL